MNKRNSEGYSDPTASEAISTISKKEKKVHDLVHLMKQVCNLAGFEVVGRIELQDKESGRRYR